MFLEMHKKRSKNIFKKSRYSKLIGIVIIFIIGISSYVFLTQNKSYSERSQAKISPIVTTRPTSIPIVFTDNLDTWKEYEIKEMGLHFKLPPELVSNRDYIKTYENQEYEGGSGLCKSFSLVKNVDGDDSECFSSDNIIRMGGTSTNFFVSRGVNFIEGVGFEYDNGIYSYRFGRSKTAVLNDKDRTIKGIDNQYGLKIILINELQDDQIGGWLTSSEIGAIINTNNTTYPGLQVVVNKSKGINEKLFSTILSTFRSNR